RARACPPAARAGDRLMLQQAIAAAPDSRLPDLVDVDFSLAIHNRTGKYFIGRDLLETPDLPLGSVYYWYIAAGEPPSGLIGRIGGRLQLLHIRGKSLGGYLGLLPRRRS